jgi:Pvc16 N-terminal domain
VIHDIDEAVRAIIERDVVGSQNGVDIEFDAPTADWAARRNAPTIDAYLYDITEDPKRRQLNVDNKRDSQNRFVQQRALPPRRYQLSYLLTAWTQRAEDEHRLLSALLDTFNRYPVLPEELLSEELQGLDVTIPVTIALPRPEARRAFDVWSSLGGELKPSLDLVIITPLAHPVEVEFGPPVMENPRFTWVGPDMQENTARAERGPAVVPARGPVDSPETVYGGLSDMTKAGQPKQGPEDAFGDGRPGRALVMSHDPGALRRGQLEIDDDGADD